MKPLFIPTSLMPFPSPASRVSHARRTAARIVVVIGAAVTTLAGTACSGDKPTTVIPTPTGTLSVVSGDSQRVVVGGITTAPFVAKLVDASGTPMAGVTVSWRVAVGTGTVAEASGVTSSAGTISNTFTSDSISGTAKVDAGLGTSVARFTIIVAPGPATAFVFGNGNGTAIQVGNSLTLTARLLDSRGNGIAGATVTWTTSGSTLSHATSVTNETGTASNVLTVTSAGRITIQASTPGFTTLAFTVDGV
jgi:adhesin/invasin